MRWLSSIVIVLLVYYIDEAIWCHELTPDLSLDSFLEILWQTTECDDFLSDINWVAVSTFDCVNDDEDLCNYPSEVCMEKTDSFDKQRQCRQLPIECVTAANGGIVPESIIVDETITTTDATTIDSTLTTTDEYSNVQSTIIIPVQLNLGRCKLERDQGESGPGCYRSYIYYFDSQLLSCKPNIYFGCGGNANKFINQLECQNACEKHFVKFVSPKTTPPTIVTTMIRRPLITLPPPTTPPSPSSSLANTIINVCNLDKPIGGNCPYIEAFYYNKASGQCEKFYFPGCRTSETNANLFQTNQQCVYAATACKLIGQTQFITQLTNNWNRFNWLEKIHQLPALITSTLNRPQALAADTIQPVAPVPRQISVSKGKNWSVESIDDSRVCRLRRAIGHQRCANGKLTQRYYFSMIWNECRLFWFRGCEGNRNNFDSLASCKQLCSS